MWKPCGPGGSPLSTVLTVAPPALSEIVMVPSASPVPVGVACLISARNSRARAGPAAPTTQTAIIAPIRQLLIAPSLANRPTVAAPLGLGNHRCQCGATRLQPATLNR